MKFLFALAFLASVSAGIVKRQSSFATPLSNSFDPSFNEIRDRGSVSNKPYYNGNNGFNTRPVRRQNVGVVRNAPATGMTYVKNSKPTMITKRQFKPADINYPANTAGSTYTLNNNPTGNPGTTYTLNNNTPTKSTRFVPKLFSGGLRPPGRNFRQTTNSLDKRRRYQQTSTNDLLFSDRPRRLSDQLSGALLDLQRFVREATDALSELAEAKRETIGPAVDGALAAGRVIVKFLY